MVKAAKKPAPAPPSDSTLAGRIRAWLPEPPPGATSLDQRTTIVFIVAILLLVIFQYFGRPDAHRGAHEVWLRPLADAVLGSHAAMAPYAHWAVSSIVWRILIPIALIVFVFHESPADYGWRWRGTLRHAPMYAALFLFMVPLIIWAATQDSFQQKYPFYKGAAEGGFSFWGYELLYGIQFAGVEFFFRGFLTFRPLQALRLLRHPDHGDSLRHGPLQQAAPRDVRRVRCRHHPRFARAQGAELVPGIFLHWAVGITMDFLAIAKTLGGIGPALRAVF